MKRASPLSVRRILRLAGVTHNTELNVVVQLATTTTMNLCKLV